MSLTLVTWNLKGAEGLDVAAVAHHLRHEGADVAFLQEVQRRQARRLAERLGARSLTWGCKHWPVLVRPEGMAVVGITRPVLAATVALTRGWRWWSWRRRILQTATVEVDGRPYSLVHAHLSPHADGGGRRVDEVARVLARDPALVVGDLNDDPDGGPIVRLQDAGLRDAWTVSDRGRDDVGGVSGATAFGPNRTQPPRRRLDYVLVGADLVVRRAAVPDTAAPGGERWGQLSDHLPLTVWLSRRPPDAPPP